MDWVGWCGAVHGDGWAGACNTVCGTTCLLRIRFVCTGTCQTCILRWIHASPFGTTGAALARKMRIVLKQFKPSLFIFSVPADGSGLFMGMGGLVRGCSWGWVGWCLQHGLRCDLFASHPFCMHRHVPNVYFTVDSCKSIWHDRHSTCTKNAYRFEAV